MMVRMEMDYKMDFWKLFRINFFQTLKFGLEIFEILQKCYSNTKFLQEIAFYHLAKVLFFSCYSLNLGSIFSIYKRFDQIDVILIH